LLALDRNWSDTRPVSEHRLLDIRYVYRPRLTAGEPCGSAKSCQRQKEQLLLGKQRLAFVIVESAGRLEKDFVSWPHAYETWKAVLELRHLRYFIAVADAGSLTVAAEQ
jgi:hypothetical protein